MKQNLKIFIYCLFIFFCVKMVFCIDSFAASEAASGLAEDIFSLSVDEVLDRVEDRYAVSGFSARFVQESTIKALDITDTASGRMLVKRPNMMRWEYEKPERQLIITDSKKLWVYRPEDNQVITGKFPSLFGDGKGAGFLSNMKMIREKFFVALDKMEKKEKKHKADCFLLKLSPKEKESGLSVIYLSISKKTFTVVQIITYNSYGDETKIELIDVQFNENQDESMFIFKIPEAAEILQFEE